MSLLSDYARDCFLGTERKLPATPLIDGVLQHTLEKIQKTQISAEQKILLTAASLHLYSTVGFIPDNNQTQALAAAEPEALSPVSHPLQIDCLRQLLADKAGDMAFCIFSHMRQQQLLIPPGLLPAFFDVLTRDKELVVYLSPLMGKRGQWLLQQQPEWAQLLVNQQTAQRSDWEEGSFEQSLAYMNGFRQQSPTAARELIIARLSELDARQRVQLVQLLSIHLSSNDEQCLDNLLKDRSKEVRQLAAGLLAQLPESALVKRASERTQMLLSEEKKLFRKQWLLQVPELFDSAWSGDAIEEKRPQSETLGQKAWWLYQLVLNLPLQWWQAHMQMSASDLLNWAITSDWQETLFRAWQQVCLREKNPIWAEAFLTKGTMKNFSPAVIDLVNCLTQEQKIAYWLPRLSEKTFSENRNMICTWAINQLKQDYCLNSNATSFSISFLEKLLKQLDHYVIHQKHQWDYTAKADYIRLLSLVPLDLLQSMSKSWPSEFSPNGTIQELLAQAHEVLRVRQLFNA